MDSFGLILDANLETTEIDQTRVDPGIIKDWFGGSSLALHLVARGRSLNPDPLSGDNPLVIMTGLLTGTPVPTACKMSLCARSPLTGLWSESTVGGYFPAGLRSTGFSGIMVTGRAPNPVYLYVDEDGGELLDASDFWGLDTVETDLALRKAHGAGAQDREFQTLTIGPAGEALVRYAAVIGGGIDGRAAGRTGMGAVMGAKNLKAVVVRGRTQVPVADRERVTGITREIMPALRKNTALLHDYGTAGGVPTVEFVGDLPIKNWILGSWKEGADCISGQAQARSILASHYACYACPIRCGKEVKLRRGPNSGEVVSGPEYETLAGFGSMVMVDDVDYVAWANDYANRQGLDTISAGSAVAMAMELCEKGILSESDFGGFRPRFGDGESLMEVLRIIVSRSGIGRLLGEGTRQVACELGGLARDMAVHVKGLEVAFHDPRAFTSMAASYATANRGACHLESLSYIAEGGGFPADLLGLSREWQAHSDDGKAQLAISMQDYLAVFNSLGLCKFLIRGQLGPDMVAQWLSASTGWDIGPDDLLHFGARFFNFRRILNVRMGTSRVDDILPPRLLAADRGEGGAAGSIPNLGRLLDQYYQLRGWTPEGIPTDATLERYGLGEIKDLIPYNTRG